MTWIRIPAALLILSYGTAWGATLTWNANTEIDLAGYRIYQCTQQPCSRTSGTASLLATLGKVTSFNIGTPAVTQYYIITAFDSANNESSDSNVATYTPPTTTPTPTPTPPPTVPPPTIGTTPVTLSFTAQQGGANPAAQTLSIANTGGGTLSWTASEDSSWLTLSPASGTGAGTVTVSVSTGTRTAGTYTGTITLAASGATTVTVPVSFTITAAPITQAPPPVPTGLRLGALQ
jgi:hypothetical protein